MRLVAVVVSLEDGELRPVFSGGTSLSKGYGLIRRFSEDLDFKLVLPKAGMARPDRRQYRSQVIEAIRAAGNWTLEDTDIQVGDESRFFSCLVSYPANFAVAPVLRPQIKLELNFRTPALPAEERSLRSLVAEAQNDDHEVPAIACVAPAETAADKLSALTWRVPTRQRGSHGDDPTVIRHLHDLAALEVHATQHPKFPELLHQLIGQDASRGGGPPGIAATTPAERLTAALETVAADPEYKREYTQFVLAMCYAEEGETPAFEVALAAARRLGARLP